jgi:hypothetical protein
MLLAEPAEDGRVAGIGLRDETPQAADRSVPILGDHG